MLRYGPNSAIIATKVLLLPQRCNYYTNHTNKEDYPMVTQTITQDLPNLTDEDIGALCQTARLIARLSIQQLADAIGETKGVVRSVESGHGVTAARVRKWGFYTGQPIRYFYGEEGTTKPILGQLDFRTWPSDTSDNKNDLSYLIG